MTTQTQNRPQNNATFSRAGTVTATKENNIIELSFSSEEPVYRYFGYEVLNHEDGAVDLSRLNEIGVLLFNHDKDRAIGSIQKAWIEGKRGKALVKFDSDEKSQIIFEKVKSGSLKGVSVGYTVSEWEEQKRDPDGEVETWIAKRWTPYEISIVTIPADPTVGVGRSMEQSTNETPATVEEPDTINKNNTRAENTGDPVVNSSNLLLKEHDIMTDKTATESTVKTVDREQIINGERARIADINALCREFDVEPDKFIKDGSDINAVRAAILEQLKAEKKPARVNVQQDEGDNFRAAAVDSLCMRSGTQITNPAKGANELRNMSLRDLAVECLAREGRGSIEKLRREDPNALFDHLARDFYNPTALFPAILDNAINKNIVEIYRKTPTTFDLWTSKGSVNDFKETKDHNYLIGGGQFEKITENGEIKASRPETHLLPTRKIDTYAMQFSMTRQAFINDDIGILAQVPGLAAAAAKRKINQQVYEMLFNNTVLVEGKKLFCAEHGNLATGSGKAGAPTLELINALMLKMQTQKDPFGKPLIVTPKTLILPVGYGLNVDTILHSTSIKTADNDYTGYNPLANKGLTYVEDPTLNALAGDGACAWFLVADAMSAKSIQVDYLRGQETPTVRRAERPGTLGIVWDIFMDWGVSALDFRGIARNDGAKIAL